MVSKRLLNTLAKAKAKYKVVGHKTVFTAYDLANTLKRKLGTVAKTVLVKADKGFTLFVLPGDRRVDLKKVKKLLGAKNVGLSTERVLTTKLKVKPGSISPLLLKGTEGIGVIVDQSLKGAKKILTGAGTFTDSLEMSAKELVRLAKATLADIGEKPKGKGKRRK